VNAAIAFAFTAGLIAAVNPCGFAMLPAYVGFFLGSGDDRAEDRQANLSRAIVTALSMSLGFLVVLGTVGILFTAGVDGLRDVIPWVVMAIGAVMVVLGVAMVCGFELSVSLPRLQRGGEDRSIWSMFLFGMSYATASLSCTLTLFLLAVVSRPDGFVAGLASVLAYIAGMSLAITALTVSMALAQTTVLTSMRRLMPHVNRVSGVILVLAGAYTVWYWYDDRFGGPGQPAGIRWVEDRSFWLQSKVQEIGGLRLGLLLAAIIAAVILVVMLWPGRRPTAPAAVEDQEAAPAP
jgi:cytochrome c-type biogenesis protein